MLRRLWPVFIPLVLLVSIYFYFYENKEPVNANSKLVVYTYSSFASNWGPGPELKKLFFEKSGINVEFLDAGEAGIIIQRILLEKEKTQADLVLGLDQFQINDSSVTSLFSDLPKFNMNIDEQAPLDKIQVNPYVAYNWSPMTFVYRTTDQNNLPKKLEDFVSKDFKGKLVLLDPRTSSPGYIFFHWIVQKLGKEKAREFFYQLKPHVYTVTPSWSAGYGLFKKKQAQYIFSYQTSPVYHWLEEKDLNYAPVELEDSLPYHIEYAGILKTSANKDVAEEFLQFLLEPDTQKIIMNKNYMLPVAAGVTKGTEFGKLKKINLFESQTQIPRDEILNIWKSIQW